MTDREYLIEHDIVFDPEFDDEPDRPLCINLNDTFAWACADGEDIAEADYASIVAAHKEFGHDGVTAWVAVRRGWEEPIEPLRSPEFYAARDKLRAASQPPEEPTGDE